MATPIDPVELFHEELDTAHCVAFSFNNTPGATLDELRQEARLALWDAAQAFDATKGTPFSSFAKSAVRNRLIDAFRKAKTFNQHISVTLDAPIGEDDTASMLDFVRDEIGMSALDSTCRAEGSQILKEVLSELPEREQTVLLSYMSGETGTVKATELGITKQSVAMIKTKALLRLKQKLAERKVTASLQLQSRRYNIRYSERQNEPPSPVPHELQGPTASANPHRHGHKPSSPVPYELQQHAWVLDALLPDFD